MTSKELTAESVRHLLDYDPETGVFRWRESHKKIRAGDVAGSIASKRYRHIQIQRRTLSAHRLAWLHFYGQWPGGLIDHINGDPHDNRIVNLRQVTARENSWNRRGDKASKSGVKGVVRRACGWEANIMADGVARYLGRFKSIDDARSAYLRAASELHGDFARGGGL